jgi:hypothetical protein
MCTSLEDVDNKVKLQLASIPENSFPKQVTPFPSSAGIIELIFSNGSKRRID